MIPDINVLDIEAKGVHIMFTRFSNSWQLLKASAKVLRGDKQLIVFPLVSFLASIVVLATFAVPVVIVLCESTQH